VLDLREITSQLRELEAEEEAFDTSVMGSAQGHEVIDRRASAGLGFTPSDVNALVEGVRRADIGTGVIGFVGAMASQFAEHAQRSHSLRHSVCQPLIEAIREIRGRLMELHGTALLAQRRGQRRAAMEWTGEALHLIQDSYSSAHTERIRGTGGVQPIKYIRYYKVGVIPSSPASRGAPLEHHVPKDPRDHVLAPGGGLKPEAASAVAASREFLIFMRRHLANPTASTNHTDLLNFMRKHLILSRGRTEPRTYYPTCRP
jgi:hypothetical protein